MQRRFELVLAMLVLVFTGSAVGASRPPQAAADAVTVPMQVELNRPYIDVALTGPTGQHVTAHAYVDTGGGAVLLSAALAEQLGLKATGKPERSQGEALAPTAVPALSIGGKPVIVSGASAYIVTDATDTLSHTDAQMMLPGRVLRQHVVVFNYPAHTFTLADPRNFKPDGTTVQATFGADMPVVQVSIAGNTYHFLLDTGGQYCMISVAQLGAWEQEHPDWPRIAGAYGPANMLFGKFEVQLSMLRIAALQWGPFRIDNAGAVSRAVGNYERFMSGVVGTPIIGSIGGNVLDHFKVTIDYPARKIYLAGPAHARDPALDMVGIMLEPALAGGYEVAGVAPGVRGINPGERLLTVDGHDVTRMPFSRVMDLLSGTPDNKRSLVLEHGTAQSTVEATIQSVF